MSDQLSIREECIQALRQAGCAVQDASSIVIVSPPDGRSYPLDSWRFDLFCVGVHERTPHACKVKTA